MISEADRAKEADPVDVVHHNKRSGWNVRFGSIATDEVEVARSRMSASPLKADNLHTISASLLSAKGTHGVLRVPTRGEEFAVA
jgi:hypothetical protein